MGSATTDSVIDYEDLNAMFTTEKEESATNQPLVPCLTVPGTKLDAGSGSESGSGLGSGSGSGSGGRGLLKPDATEAIPKGESEQ